MSRGPYRPRPRLRVDQNKHQVGDAVHVGATRWLIRSIQGDNVVLEASSAPAGILWNTTLNNLPAPTKEQP